MLIKNENLIKELAKEVLSSKYDIHCDITISANRDKLCFTFFKSHEDFDNFFINIYNWEDKFKIYNKYDMALALLREEKTWLDGKKEFKEN